MSSVHRHISAVALRHIAAALAAIVAVACSDQQIADPSPAPSLSVSQESAALFETNGVLGPAWGTATIKRGPGGVQVQLLVTDPAVLAALQGDAITIWMATFHNPDACAPGPHCLASDLGNPATGSALQYAGGQVLGNGPINLAVNAREGDTKTQIAGAAAGLIDAGTDEIHVVIRSHGAPIPGLVDEQTHSLNGGCPPNACSSVAVAIFM